MSNDPTGTSNANQSGSSSNANQSGNGAGAQGLGLSKLEELEAAVEKDPENPAVWVALAKAQRETLANIPGLIESHVGKLGEAAKAEAAKAAQVNTAIADIASEQRALRPMYRDHKGKYDDKLMEQHQKVAVQAVKTGAATPEQALEFLRVKARERQSITKEKVEAIKEALGKKKPRSATKPKRKSGGKPKGDEDIDLRDNPQAMRDFVNSLVQ